MLRVKGSAFSVSSPAFFAVHFHFYRMFRLFARETRRVFVFPFFPQKAGQLMYKEGFEPTAIEMQPGSDNLLLSEAMFNEDGSFIPEMKELVRITLGTSL